MNGTVRAEQLFHAGFAIILLRQPMQYLIGPNFLAIFGLGVGLCLWSLLINSQRLRLDTKDQVLAAFILGILILHTLLALSGDRATQLRSLWSSALAQLLITVLFLHYRRSSQAWKFLKFILATTLLVECTLAFLQVSYYSTGIGLAPVFEGYERWSFVSGSFFNANDFSAFITSYTMALCSCWMIEGKFNRGYVFIGLAAMAVFVSLSRTAFVFMILFACAALLQAGKQVIFGSRTRNGITTLLVLFVIFGSVTYLLSTSFLVDTTVFERSIRRIGQIEQITTDESVSIRSLVYLRLLEGFPNLWFGTFSDLDYSIFFKSGDDPLMQINPHSFVAEMAFLYGWLGFFSAVGLLGIISVGIMRNRELSFSMRCIAVGSLIFFQSVPSSILGYASFFMPYLLLMYCQKIVVAGRFETTRLRRQLGHARAHLS